MIQKEENARGLDLNGLVCDFIENVGLSSEKVEWESIPGDGSKRRFWRIRLRRSGVSYIVMENGPSDGYAGRENLAYLHIGRHLFNKGLPVPEIHRYNLEKGWFIMTDLGEVSLQNRVSNPTHRIPIYERVIEELFRLQVEGAGGFDTNWTCQTKKYDRHVMRRYEADYFRDAFLNRYLGLELGRDELEMPFNYLAEKASSANFHFFLHRDFQSRNIMISGERVGIIDWQGGRLGPLGYDLASLLIDPYVGLTHEERDHILGCYLQLLKSEHPGEAETFEWTYPYLAIQRNLQILGAFSFLSKVRGKTYFEEYIPTALHSLLQLLKELDDRKLSELKGLVESLK